MTADADPSVVIQALQSAYILKITDYEDLSKKLQASNPAKGVQLVTKQLLEKLMKPKNWQKRNTHRKNLFCLTKGKRYLIVTVPLAMVSKAWEHLQVQPADN